MLKIQESKHHKPGSLGGYHIYTLLIHQKSCMTLGYYNNAMIPQVQGTLDYARFLLAQGVQVPNNWVLGFWVIVIIVQVLGKYMIIRYLDP